ncbi:MAG: hypothetical protein RR922_01895 [Clostridia bacterium]
MLKNDVIRGQKINESSINKISVYKKDIKVIPNMDYTVSNKVSKENLKKGQILDKNMFIEEKDYLKSSSNKELISISIKEASDVSGYLIKKDSIVNMYVTAKSKYVEDIVNSKKILKTESGFSTIELLKDIKIIKVIDKNGVEVTSGDNKIYDEVIIEVNKEDAILLNNLKSYSEFSFTLVR